jgi:hypothetical protein
LEGRGVFESAWGMCCAGKILEKRGVGVGKNVRKNGVARR